MNAGNARIWTENARVHLYARYAHFGPALAYSDDIRKHLPAPHMPSRQAGGHVLTPGRYVGAEAAEDDLPAPSAARQAGGEPFEDKMKRLTATLREQQKEAACLRRASHRGRQAKLDAATCLRQAQRGRQVAANLRELGYG